MVTVLGLSQEVHQVFRIASSNCRPIWPAILLAAACLSSTNPSHAQAPAPSPVRNGSSQHPPAASPAAPADNGPTVDVPDKATIEARLERVKTATELEQSVRDTLVEKYNKALEALASAERFGQQAARFQELREAVADRRAELKKLLESPAQELALGLEDDAPLAQWEQVLAGAVEEQQKWDKDVKAWQAEPKRQADRLAAIPNEISALKKQQGDLRQQLAAPPAADGDEQADAQRMAWAARLYAATKQIAALEAEAAYYTSASDLLPLEQQWAARQLGPIERRIAKLRETINSRRTHEAATQAAEATERAVNTEIDPTVKKWAEANAELVQQREEVAGKIARAEERLEAIETELRSLAATSDTMAKREDAVGLTPAIGAQLRHQRAELPDVREHQGERAARAAELRQVQLRMYELGDEAVELADIEGYVEQEMATLTRKTNKIARNVIRNALRDTLKKRLNYLNDLIADLDVYEDQLVEVDTKQRELIAETLEYASFIDERVLWIRSTPAVNVATLRGALSSAAALADPVQWQFVAETAWADAQSRPGIWLLALAILGPLLIAARRMRRQLSDMGELAAKSTTESFGPTARALVLTLLIAGTIPALLAFLGWRLTVPLSAGPFVSALGVALLAVAVVYFPAEVVLKLCRSRGLGEAHFRWSRPALGTLRRNVRWLMLILLPATLLVALFEGFGHEPGTDPLGRLVFIVAALAVAVFASRVLNPTRGAVREYIDAHANGLLSRWRYLWYPICVAAPLALAVAVAAGYYYTALRLVWRLPLTLWLIIGVVLVNAMLLRWLLLARRALAIRQVRQRREALAAEAGGEATEPHHQETEVIDLSALNVQTKKLLRAFVLLALFLGLGALWADVLPAFGILDDITLPTSTEEIPITLADLLIGLIIGAMTIIAARNVPGLLEIAVLQRLPLDPGARYAATTVTRYLITVVGVVLAFNAVGIGWSRVQWLVAGVGVGLGFGLQEIFANFVSGLILLFERPMRVGDIVTVGETSGIVSRIHMRATTITDWDRKELVVPNKEFITGRLVNWTLTDTTIRLVIQVGVAYGSDTQKAHELLLKIAREHPCILDDPEPIATFESFGDSTLDFVLRCYMSTTNSLLQIKHELNTAIDNAFKEAHIEIAFPQRDIHIRSVEQQPPPLTTNGQHSRPEEEVAQT